MSVRKSAAEHSNKILLRACLDMYAYPVWITDESGVIVVNNGLAEEILSQNVPIPSSIFGSDVDVIQVKGRRWRYIQHELNHETGCQLHELKDAEDASMRLKDSVNRLAAALEKRSVGAVKHVATVEP